jgi:hypothetical protein
LSNALYGHIFAFFLGVTQYFAWSLSRATGKRIASPLVLIASDGGYRVRCKLLPRKTRLKVVMAIAQVIDFPKPGQQGAPPRADVFDRTYALKVDQNDDIAHWYGHGTDLNGDRIEEVYKAVRVIPKNVKVDGHYNAANDERTLSKRIEVKVIGDALKKTALYSPWSNWSAGEK